MYPARICRVFWELPNELMIAVMACLADNEDRQNMRLICKHWRTAVDESITGYQHSNINHYPFACMTGGTVHCISSLLDNLSLQSEHLRIHPYSSPHCNKTVPFLSIADGYFCVCSLFTELLPKLMLVLGCAG